MKAQRAWILFIAFFVAAWVAMPPVAHGDLDTIFRNLQFAGNRNFIADPQNGPLFDNNIYKQAVQYNPLGQGWTLEQFRFFGPDSWDNPNTVDLGPLKMQLGRDPTVVTNAQPVGLHDKFGYTTTGIPDVFFEAKTGQRNFDVFSGQTSFTAAPINYNITFDSGFQKYNWTGNMLINSSGDVNALGFYNLDLRLMNVGNASADGVVIHDSSVTDFDTGPIHVSGNLALDAIGSLFQGTGATDLAAPFRIGSGATKDKKTDDLMARLNSGEQLSNDDMQYLVQQMIKTAFLNDPVGFMTNGMPDTVPGFEGLSLKQSQAVDPAAIQAANNAATAQTGDTTPSAITPEPGTLLLLAAVAGTVGLLRRRLFVAPPF
ncbi:MAG TPA: PEP-CTERM sorting domain-containing protein [Phycisphaerae bacterium]|nr:PEP-CTERM sorting domain-containing protein [Phycisphaerae bacterium]